MNISTILFDLDGTLLPMEQSKFVKAYTDTLAAKFSALGYDSDGLLRAIWHGFKAVVKNSGELTNRELFLQSMSSELDVDMNALLDCFDDYYENEFQTVRLSCGYSSQAAETVKRIKNAGYRVAIATNPIFPRIATESRVRWAGLDISDFELCTTYETSHFAKPNPKYYSEVTEKLGVAPTSCVMVGNDMLEDTVAENIGIRPFVLTDCIIEREGRELSRYPHGSFKELLEYLKI